MADAAAARREARRRKILQNSEARLKRLAGVELETQDSQDAKKSVETPTPTTVKTTTCEDLILQSKTSTKVSREENRPSIESQELVNRVTEELTRDEDRRNLDDPQSQESQDKNTSEVLNGVNVGMSGVGTMVQDNSGTEERWWTGHVKHMFVLVFAVIVRFLLASEGLQHIVMKSAVIPFLMLQCGVIGFDILIKKNAQPTQPTMSLLSTALVLSGVPKETIAMVTRTTAYLTTILSDFALYMFVFLVTHSLLEVVN